MGQLYLFLSLFVVATTLDVLFYASFVEHLFVHPAHSISINAIDLSFARPPLSLHSARILINRNRIQHVPAHIYLHERLLVTADHESSEISIDSFEPVFVELGNRTNVSIRSNNDDRSFLNIDTILRMQRRISSTILHPHVEDVVRVNLFSEDSKIVGKGIDLPF